MYRGLGAVTMGLAFVVTGADRSVSNRVWNSSVEGTYLVTPRMIEGKDRVRCVGPSQRAEALAGRGETSLRAWARRLVDAPDVLTQ